jgi:hypothetical protein
MQLRANLIAAKGVDFIAWLPPAPLAVALAAAEPPQELLMPAPPSTASAAPVAPLSGDAPPTAISPGAPFPILSSAPTAADSVSRKRPRDDGGNEGDKTAPATASAPSASTVSSSGVATAALSKTIIPRKAQAGGAGAGSSSAIPRPPISGAGAQPSAVLSAHLQSVSARDSVPIASASSHVVPVKSGSGRPTGHLPVQRAASPAAVASAGFLRLGQTPAAAVAPAATFAQKAAARPAIVESSKAASAAPKVPVRPASIGVSKAASAVAIPAAAASLTSILGGRLLPSASQPAPVAASVASKQPRTAPAVGQAAKPVAAAVSPPVAATTTGAPVGSVPPVSGRLQLLLAKVRQPGTAAADAAADPVTLGSQPQGQGASR